MLKISMQKFFWVAASFSIMFISACTSGIYGRMYVESDIPDPVMQTLPLKVGVLFPDEMSDYVADVKPQSDETFEVGVRDSQKVVLNKVLHGVFASVEELDSSMTPTTDVDLILKPNIDDFSLLTAKDSGSDFFAVSMRHSIDVLTPQGKKLNSIVINSYGRQRKSSEIMNNEDGISGAVNNAFRDFAVNAIVGLTNTFAGDQQKNGNDQAAEQ